jgi:hypothetical protein
MVRMARIATTIKTSMRVKPDLIFLMRRYIQFASWYHHSDEGWSGQLKLVKKNVRLRGDE